MPQCAPTPFLSQGKLVIELNRILSSTLSFPEGNLPSPHKARRGVAGRITFIGSMTCLGLTTPWPPQVAGGGGRDSIRGVEPRLWGLVGWSRREPRRVQVQTEVQQRYYYS